MGCSRPGLVLHPLQISGAMDDGKDIDELGAVVDEIEDAVIAEDQLADVVGAGGAAFHPLVRRAWADTPAGHHEADPGALPAPPVPPAQIERVAAVDRRPTGPADRTARLV